MRHRPTIEDTFAGFFADGYPRLVAALTLLTGDGDLARESVDEAVARAWEFNRRGRTIQVLPAWVRTVALNVARGRVRRRSVERAARSRLLDLTVHDSGQERANAAMDVRAALATLPARQREVTILFYFLDLSVEQIADELEVTTGTVKTCLHRARTALAAVLGEHACEEVRVEV